MGHGNFKPDPRIQQALVQSHHIDAARKQMSEQAQMQRMMFVQQFLADTAQKLFVQELDKTPEVSAKRLAEWCNRSAMELGIALGMIQRQPEQKEEQNDETHDA